MLCRCGLYGGYQKGCYEVSITVTLGATIGDTSGFYGVLGSRAHLLYGFRGFQVYGLGFDPSRFGFQKVFQEVSGEGCRRVYLRFLRGGVKAKS